MPRRTDPQARRSAALLAAALGSVRHRHGGVAAAGGGAGGPVLVVVEPADPFGRYYAEILRAEGLNEFDVATRALDAATLAGYEVASSAQTAADDAQVSMLTNWVQNGGKLIAMRPDTKLASLLGLSLSGGTLSNGYLMIDTTRAPGAGIINHTMQFHGTADRWTVGRRDDRGDALLGRHPTRPPTPR